MWRKISALTGILLFTISMAWSQGYVESALTFSQTTPGGSARIQAMGGSQIALGGDYSSAASNPAGLGMFNRSEVTLTPGFTSYNNQSHYFGVSQDQSKSKFVVPGFSLVLHIPSHGNSGFQGGAFAITMTRVNDFNAPFSYNGDPSTSKLQSFIDDANGYTTDQFDPNGSTNHNRYNSPTGLAYFNYLIGPAYLLDANYPDDEYFTDVKKLPHQSETVQSDGIINQWNFSYGGNYKDILFFGASIGVSSLRYKTTKTFSESFTDDEFVNGWDMNENLKITGTGVNATFGATVRPVDFMQIGISYTSPTFYQLSETSDATMNSSWKDFLYYSNKPNYGGNEQNKKLNNESSFTDQVISEYSLSAPHKFSAGLALISKYGLITGDVELRNYSKAKYTSSYNSYIDFTDSNLGINDTYKSVVNYRGGLEGRYKIFRLRAGYGVQANPYRGSDYDNSIKTISAGVGIKLDKFHVDFAWVQSKGNSLYAPYFISDGSGPIVELQTKIVTGLVTLGVNF
jgi:hypothetical protein